MVENKIISKRTLIGLIGCLGGLCSHFVLGSIFQWGIINVYVTSYYKLTDPSLTLEANSIAFPLMMLGISLTITPGIYLAQKAHPLLVLGVVVIVQSALVFASSYMLHIWGFFALFGILFGLVTGLNFMIAMVECNKYFPGKKMYINGFILIGSGCGPLVFGMFSYNFLNPQKIPSNKGYYYGTPQLQHIAQKVPQCIRWLSLMYLLLGIIAWILLIGVCLENKKVQKQLAENKTKNLQNKMQDNPFTHSMLLKQHNPMGSNHHLQTQVHIQQDKSKYKYQVEIAVEIRDTKNKQNQIVTGQPQNLKAIICSKVFWVGISLYFLGTIGTLFINVSYKTYVKLINSDDQFLTIIGAISSLGNGLSRIVWGIVFKHTGYKFIIALNLIIQIIVYSTYRFTAYTPGLYLLFVFLIGCCFGGFTSANPTYCQIVFGNKWGSKIFGIYVISVSIANFVQYGFVVGLSPHITLNGVIYICLGLVTLALFLLITTNFQAPWKNPTENMQYCIKTKKPDDLPEGQQQLK